MLGDIDLSLLPHKPEIWLAKPNKEIIAKLNGRAGIGFSRFGKRNKFLKHTQMYKLNSINEMEFAIPFEVEINHALVRNHAVDLIKDRFLLKVLYMDNEEWYIITDVTNAMDGEKDLKIIKCRSLGYELVDRFVRNYKVVSTNLSTVLNGGNTIDSNGNTVPFRGLLNGTLWTLDPSYDVTFDTIFRALDISKASVLDALIQVAKTFNAIILWDTVNRKINFQQLVNIGHDKGFKISYKNYMKSVENESKSDELCTRFFPYGKGGIQINEVNHTGLPYIDDFSFFMYPFTRDLNRNVLKQSNYMSDSLCHALLDYQTLVNSKKGQYSTLLTALTGYQIQLTARKNEMEALNTTLKSIHAELDIAQSTNQTSTAAGLLLQQTSQVALIVAKQSEIDLVSANISNTQASIAALQVTMSSSTNFTNVQLEELIAYVKEKEWVDDKITDAQSLYDQALQKFQDYNTPQTIVKVDLVNLMEMVTEQRNWDKLSLGDIIQIEYDKIGTNVKAKIVEISFDHNEGNIALTIANIDDLLRDEEKVFKMLYQGIGAASTISVNSDRWNGIDDVTKNINAIYENGIDAAKLAIASAVNNTVTVNNRGITIQDSVDHNRFIRETNGWIGLTKDGGNTFGTAISADGVYAPALIGQILITALLYLKNQAGSVSIDGDGINITQMNLSLITADGNHRIIINPAVGIKIQQKVNDVWQDKLYTDSLGDLFMKGYFQAGEGERVFTVNSEGMSLGASTWATAPLHADYNGNVWMNKLFADSAEIKNSIIDKCHLFGCDLTLQDPNNINNVIKADPTIGIWAGDQDFTKAGVSISLDGKFKIAGKTGTVFIDTKDGYMDMNSLEIRGVSKLTAEQIVTKTITAAKGYISDLTVSSLNTVPNSGNVGDIVNSIEIENQYQKWMTQRISSKVQAKDTLGNNLYWTNSTLPLLTTTVTPNIAYEYDYDQKLTKKSISFSDDGSQITVVDGAGDGHSGNSADGLHDSGKAYQEKANKSIGYSYFSSNEAKERSIKLRDEGIYLLSENEKINFGCKDLFADVTGRVSLSHSSGFKFELNSTGDTFKLTMPNGTYQEFSPTGRKTYIVGDDETICTGNYKVTASRIDLN